MEPDEGDIAIEVVYARAHDQLVVTVRVPVGTTAREALVLSGVARSFDIDPAKADVGIYGRRVSHDAVLAAGDRLEVYRPLIADPKQARRGRARKSG